MQITVRLADRSPVSLSGRGDVAQAAKQSSERRYDRDLCFPRVGSALGATRENMVGVGQAGLQVTDDRS